MSTQHIRILAALQMTQGGLEFLGGLIFALSPGGLGPGPGGAETWVALSLAGLVIAAAGLFRLVAGLLNMFYRGRVLGMAALVMGLLSAVTCCCLPTSVALCVYGFVVYTNKDVRRAFAMRAAGASLDQIDRAPR